MFSGKYGARSVFIMSALALISTACGSSTPAAEASAAAPVHAGECFAKEVADLDDVGPNFDSKVACTSPHIYEVADVIAVPSRFLRGTNDKARLANRAALGSFDQESTSAADELHAFAAESCGPVALREAGISHTRVAGKSLAEVGAQLSFGGAQMWFNLSSRKAWLAGQHQVVCSVRYMKYTRSAADAEPAPIRSASRHPAFYDFLTSDFPEARRQCVMFDTQLRYSLNPCTAQHYGEMFFSYDAKRAFGERFVSGLDPDDLTERASEKLSDPCFNALSSLIGDNYSAKLSGSFDLGEGGWYTGETDFYTVNCMVTPYDSDHYDMPGGSIVDNPQDVELVRIGTGQRT